MFGSFWINVVFILVIHSGTCAVCRHLFISSASLSWMEGNFLNQKLCIPSWPGVFQLDIFLSVVLSKSVCISASSPSSSLVISFIHSSFSLFFWLSYFSHYYYYYLKKRLEENNCSKYIRKYSDWAYNKGGRTKKERNNYRDIFSNSSSIPLTLYSSCIFSFSFFVCVWFCGGSFLEGGILLLFHF